jgi:hypothetical protein
MASDALEGKILEALDILIGILSSAVLKMEGLIEKPVFLDRDDPSRARYRFENPDAKIFQVLMCARVASGLRAAFVLLLASHTTEMGVLFRTIDDFLADIMAFADEIVEGTALTTAQRDFVSKYFVDDPRTPEEILAAGGTRAPRINHNERRQKVQAAEGRVFGAEDPHRTRSLAKVVDDVFNGVVHGDYASSMEMYGGEDPYFHTKGMPVRFSGYRHHLGIYIHRALNAFFKVAYNLGDHDLANELRERRREFEKTIAYTAD